MEVDVLENYIKVVSKRVFIFESFLHFYINIHSNFKKLTFTMANKFQ